MFFEHTSTDKAEPRRSAPGVRRLSGWAAVLCCVGACTTVSDELPFAVEPSIELLRISDTELTEFTESLELTLRYEDGDGDLGNADADVNSIFVRDERLTEPDAYYLAPLAPADARIGITGNLTVILSPTFRLGNAATETTTLTLWLTDRAGHESNRLTVGPLTIVPQ